MIKNKIAFQGELGAYSHIAVNEIFDKSEIKTCATFEEAFTTNKYGFSTSSGATYQDVPVTTTSAHGDLA